jgi:lysophospholipase L1-like esterase
MEIQNRWKSPRQAKLSFRGFYASGSIPIVKSKLPVIEFVGDSITEGVIIDVGTGEESHETRCIQGDVTASFAWKTAALLHADPVITGFGAQGIVVNGNGGVPHAAEAYPYVYDLCPYNDDAPDIIVIQHGTNDALQNIDSKNFIDQYINFLHVIRQKMLKTSIVCLAPFIGIFNSEVEQAVKKHNADHNDNIYYIDTTGWVEQEPLHPDRQGTDKIASILAPIIKTFVTIQSPVEG